MPWTPQSFADRHNHSLSPEEAAHASRIANAILRGGAPERIAIATASKIAEHHRLKRASGGNVPSYLAGTAGSPVNAGALPTYIPQQPTSTGILPSGLMSTPQVGSYALDPNTGALSGASQAALQALAQRGLNIGGNSPPPSILPPPPAGGNGGGGTGVIGGTSTNPNGNNTGSETGGGGQGQGVEGAGGGSGGGGSSGGGNDDSHTIDIIGGQPASLGSVSLKDVGLGGLGGVFGGPAGVAIGAGMGALKDLIGGATMGTPADPAGQPTVPDLVTGSLSGFGDITSGGGGSGGVSDPGDTDTGHEDEIARGGAIRRAKRAAGGGAGISPSMQSPWWERSEARQAGAHPSGLVNSPVGGRSDHLPMNVPGGSYVIPADVVSGMGQGNTMAGAHAFDNMIHAGPFGTKLPMPKIGGTLPKPPAPPKVVDAHHFSRGGRTKGHIPIIVAGGERIVSPEEVAKLAGGDVEKGHKMLDRFVVECRKHVIDHTKKLPGPVK